MVRINVQTKCGPERGKVEQVSCIRKQRTRTSERKSNNTLSTNQHHAFPPLAKRRWTNVEMPSKGSRTTHSIIILLWQFNNLKCT